MAGDGKKDDGGNAFPSKFSLGIDGYGNEVFGAEQGMSLRDWFAGQIAAAAVTNAEGLGSIAATDRRKMFGQAASLAYEFADAMLAERAKGGA